MKIFSWNVNGIRAVFKTTFRDWLAAYSPDILCLQETKATHTELSEEFTQLPGYWAYFNSSSLKKGHSGVAVYTKAKPISVETTLGIPRFDDEGRCLKLAFKDFILFNFYIPNGSRDQHEIPYKLEVYKKLSPIFEALAGKNVILTGDFNIAHQGIDVFNAKTNQNSTMFTPAEREQITNLINLGYTDVFRYLYPDKKAYTWWPYMAKLRERDIGWRIDYFFVSNGLLPLVTDCASYRQSLGSDHAPLELVLKKQLEVAERPVYKKAPVQPDLFGG